MLLIIAIATAVWIAVIIKPIICHIPYGQSEHSIPQPNDSLITLYSDTELSYKHLQLRLSYLNSNLKHIVP